MTVLPEVRGSKVDSGKLQSLSVPSLHKTRLDISNSYGNTHDIR